MISQIRRFFSAQNKKRSISRPKVPQSGLLQVKTLATGADLYATTSRIVRQNPAHGGAVLAATQDVFARTGVGRTLDPRAYHQVHLTHLVFAPGTSRQVMQKKLPIGVQATQLGAACVRGRNGHLHVYAMVHVGGRKPAKKVRFAVD